MNKLNSIFKKILFSLKEFLLKKTSRKEALKQLVHFLYTKHSWREKKISTYPMHRWISNKNPAALFCYPPTDGNISSLELLFLSQLIKTYTPKTLLEIGTFNGLTTLHLAINSSDTSVIHTLDLKDIHQASAYQDPEDLKFISHPSKELKLYAKHEVKKILFHQGNSMTFSFDSFGSLDFAFIDGGHSYEIVKNDTEKVLEKLNPGGLILWHDYGPCTPGVFTYLNHLAQNLTLEHVENTSFVLYKKPSVFL